MGYGQADQVYRYTENRYENTITGYMNAERHGTHSHVDMRLMKMSSVARAVSVAI